MWQATTVDESINHQNNSKLIESQGPHEIISDSYEHAAIVMKLGMNDIHKKLQLFK